MKKLLVCSLIVIASSPPLFSQEDDVAEKPKLVIGIVVDQMRYDYLEKFGPYFSEYGFKKLQREGFSYNNMNYNYKPTYTGPGHASIFTGASPSIHGIVGNNWYSRAEGESVYCVKVSTDSGYVLSPNRLLSESLGDVIKSSSMGKVYGVALKDRGAILPVGHAGDGAYWFSSEKGEWESSAFYPMQSPQFLEQFNTRNFKSEALAKNWTLDDELIGKEINWVENGNSVQLQKFDHDLSLSFNERKWSLLKAIPFGNQMSADFAKHIIKDEKLGVDSTLDFLSLSFSATDYVGHTYGVESAEVVATYVELDKTIANFIDFLDQEVGKSNYLLFLSSDHGADFSREFLVNQNIKNGRLNIGELKHGLDAVLDSSFGDEEWIVSLQNLNVYLSQDLKQKYSNELEAILDVAASYLSNVEGIKQVINPLKLEKGKNKIETMVSNGFLEQRSGDLILVEKEHWTSYSDKGSTHGSPYSYDAHVPFILYGTGVSTGNSDKHYNIVDIAPTICTLLGIPFPNGSIGNIITEHRK